jgi:hypothetical protein
MSKHLTHAHTQSHRNSSIAIILAGTIKKKKKEGKCNVKTLKVVKWIALAAGQY